MTEDNTESLHDESNPEDDSVEKTQRSVLMPMVVAISLLLAIAASAGTGYIWFYAEKNKASQSHQTTTQNKQLELLERVQQQAKIKNNASQEALRNQQQTISTRLDGISEKLGRNSHDWAVSEIRYTLRQASIRLQLFKDKETALVALKIADKQLAKLADPALHKVRATLNKEIIALASVKTVDVEGISLKLSALSDQVKALSIKRIGQVKQETPTVPVTAEEEPTLVEWKKHADVIWSEMKTLVTIRRTDKKVIPLLSEQESKEIKQALGLKIEITRLALLQGNTTLFQESLKEASTWLNTYFNTEDTAVVTMTTQLKELSELSLEPDFPDISGALSKLETLQNSTAPAKEKKAK